MPVRRALLFDLDGTLVDSAVDIAAALSRLSTSRGGPAVTSETVRPLVSRGVEVLVREALGETEESLEDDITRFRQILATFPANPDSIYPGVVDALGALTANGHPMAIVTNKPEGLSRLLLDQLGLVTFFSVIVGGDTLPSRKPDPAPLEHALAALGAKREEAIMIGDSEVDAAAAMAAELPFALFEGGYGAKGADTGAALRFADFARLPGLLSAAGTVWDARPPDGRTDTASRMASVEMAPGGTA